MAYRRKNDYAKRQRWNRWLESNRSLVEAAGLPGSVVLREEAFWYFLQNTYNYVAWAPAPSEPWFSVTHLDENQREALRKFITLTVREFHAGESEQFLLDLSPTYEPRRSQ